MNSTERYKDPYSVALRDLIDKGYRTDGEWAIFEKQVYVSPLSGREGRLR